MHKPLKPIPPKPDRGTSSANSNVSHPSHYNQGSLEVIDAIEGLGLNFHAGNVLKYIARYKFKNGVEDLQKASWYLNRLIESEEKQNAERTTSN